MDDLAQTALVIMREWEWLGCSEFGDVFVREALLGDVITKLAFDRHPDPKKAVLDLLVSGDLASRADFEWRLFDGYTKLERRCRCEILKPHHWSDLAQLIDDERAAPFILDEIQLHRIGEGLCYPYDWNYMKSQFFTASSTPINPMTDTWCREESFFAENIYVWPRSVVEVDEPIALNNSPLSNASGRSGGRPPANWWPDFAEELAYYIFDRGIPEGQGHDGQSEIMNVVFERMTGSGKLEPTRATVQPVINAVLRRIRSAGN